MLQRRDALKSVGIDLDQIGDDVGRRAGVDDMLDAGVAAWSARRILAGNGGSMPETPELGPHGEKMAIWF
jgi:predicted RNase H-like nuclease